MESHGIILLGNNQNSSLFSTDVIYNKPDNIYIYIDINETINKNNKKTIKMYKKWHVNILSFIIFLLYSLI